MKRRVMAVVAALAVMCFGTTALAAGSPTAGTTSAVTTVAAGQQAAITAAAPTTTPAQMLTATTVGTDSASVAIEVKAVGTTTVSETVTQAKNILTDLNALATIVDAGDVAGAQAIKAAAADKNATVSASVKTVLNLEATNTTGKPVFVDVKNADIKLGKTYVVLHYVGGTKGWETLPAVVAADGELGFYTDTFSPFAIVEIAVNGAKAPTVTPAAPTAPANGANTTTSTGTSPKTGETASLALIALLLCAAGVLVSGKKLEEA